MLRWCRSRAEEPKDRATRGGDRSRARCAHRRRGGGRPPSDPDTGPVLGSTLMARNVRLARLGARAGGRHAVARAQGVFASAERREALDRSVELRHAEDVARELGQMKGALMKLGQMVSYLDEGLPEHVRVALSQLQQDAPPMSVELAAATIEHELGAPAGRASSPSSTRSRSRLRPSGRSTAPSHATVGPSRSRCSTRASPRPWSPTSATSGSCSEGSAVPIRGSTAGPLVDELRDASARGARLPARGGAPAAVRRLLRGASVHPRTGRATRISAPGACSRPSSRVGVRFAEAREWPQEQRDLAGEAIFRFVFRSFYRLHLFNGDPHPGNYLFRPDGHVTFLDFGLVKQFLPADIDVIRRLIQTIVLEPDPVAFRQCDGGCRVPAHGRAGLRRGGHRVLRALLQPHA